MAAGPNDSDDGPDFSFLGDQSAPKGGDHPDFGESPPSTEVPDFSSFGDVQATPDFSDEGDSAETSPVVKDEPASAIDQPAAKPPTAKRLNPEASKSTPPASPTAQGQPNGESADDIGGKHNVESKRGAAAGPDLSAGDVQNRSPEDGVPRKLFSIVAGYAAALTLLFLGLLFTGRIALSGRSVLESLPDVQPLKSNEFRKVPEEATLPDGHSLRLGESQQFGDIVLTPLRVTREPITFTSMINGTAVTDMKSKPVLKLWFRMQNVSPDVAFPPWDVALMSHRSEQHESAVANSWLKVHEAGTESKTQVLNFYHSPDSNLDLTDHNSRKLLNPGEEMTSFIASSEAISHVVADKVEEYRWRIQIRKGVHVASGNGVTTLVDVSFLPTDIDA